MSAWMYNTCPECGAECYTTARKCWMCGRSLAATGAAGENAFVAARDAEPRRVRSRATDYSVDNMTLAVMSGGLLLIGGGVALEAPGLGIMYALIMLPALIATFVKRRRRLRSHETPGWSETASDFIGGIAIAIGILIVLPIVAVLALAIFCAVANTSFR